MSGNNLHCQIRGDIRPLQSVMAVPYAWPVREVVGCLEEVP
jgi:hypothetical protein